MSKSKWFRISTSKMDQEWFLFLSSGAVKGWLYICKHCEETMYSQKDLGRCSALHPKVLALKANIQVEEAEEVIQTLISVGELRIEGDSWVLTDLSAFASEKTLAKLDGERTENPVKSEPKPQNAAPVGIIPDNAEKSGITQNNSEKVVPYADCNEDLHKEKEPSGEGSKNPLPPDLELVSDQSKWWTDPVSGKIDELASVLGRWAEYVKWKTGIRAFPDSVIDRQAMQGVATWLLEFLPDQDTLTVQLSSLAEWAFRAPKSRQTWTHPHLVLRKCLGEKEESWRKVRRQRQWDAERSANGQSAAPPPTQNPPKKIEILDPKDEWAKIPAPSNPVEKLVGNATARLRENDPDGEDFLMRRESQIQQVLGSV